MTEYAIRGRTQEASRVEAVLERLLETMAPMPADPNQDCVVNHVLNIGEVNVARVLIRCGAATHQPRCANKVTEPWDWEQFVLDNTSPKTLALIRQDIEERRAKVLSRQMMSRLSSSEEDGRAASREMDRVGVVHPPERAPLLEALSPTIVSSEPRGRARIRGL